MSTTTSPVTLGNICQGLDCEKPATLQCPTCIKLNLPASHFCAQDCFKKNWPMHKKVHTSTAALSNYNPFPSFPFTGTLRPVYPLSEKRLVPDHIARPDYAKTGIPLSELKLKSSTQIKVLNAKECEKMRMVCKLGREVLDIGARAIRVGITTDELDRIIHEATIERDCYPSPLNYHHFPKSCCISVNEVICHGIPDQRPLEDGDIVNLDISLYKDGFHADLNETYLVGNVDEKSRHLVDVARTCLDKAIEIVKPGTLYRDLGAVIEKYAKSQGTSVVRTYCGHGIHELFHASPNVPHYAKNKAIGVMKAGHCFTIEPMINLGKWQELHWPDDWTAVTKDGERSAQFEHTLLVTETGCEIL